MFLLMGATNPPNPNLVELGNSRTEIAVGGKGRGTVIFEAGLGDSMATWNPVIGSVGRFAGTFAYNRPGYGKSGPRLAHPNGVEIARHLREVLRSRNPPKPWVLVGHSLGGSYVMHFAKLYPQDVQAVVLIDGTPPGQTQMLKAEMPGIFRLVKTLSKVMGGDAASEFSESQSAGDDFRALGPFPAIPVFLLRRSVWSPVEPDGFRRRVVQLQREVASLSPCPVEREVQGAGHYVHRDKPAEVVETIRKAVESKGC